MINASEGMRFPSGQKDTNRYTLTHYTTIHLDIRAGIPLNISISNF